MKKKNININYKKIGKRIKNKREDLKLTQDELADKANVSSKYISNIENATSHVGLQALVNIANVLHVGVEYLLSDTIENNSGALTNEIINSLEDLPKEDKAILVDVMKFAAKKIIEEKNE